MAALTDRLLSPSFKEGWRFGLMQKLAKRPHKYAFTWNQPGIGGGSRSFIVQQSTIPQANWGLFAGAELEQDDDLVIGDDPENPYDLHDIHAKFGNKIYLQNPDNEDADFSAVGEEKAKRRHQKNIGGHILAQGSWVPDQRYKSFSVYAKNEGEFDVKMERALNLRWAARVRDWNRAARASELPIQELNYNNGVDPYVLSTAPVKLNQKSALGEMWTADIYDPFNSPLGFINHPLTAENQNVTFVSDDSTARLKTLRTVKTGQELFWSYGDAYDMDPAPDTTHFHLGREAVADAMLGVPPFGSDHIVNIKNITKFEFTPAVCRDAADTRDAYYTLKCAWEPYWTLNDWIGLGRIENVPWNCKGIEKLVGGFNAIGKDKPYEHFKHVLENFFGGTKTALPLQKLRECQSQFNISDTVRAAFGLEPQVYFGSQIVVNEKGQNIISCSFQYAHREGGGTAAELFFYFEQIPPPAPPAQVFVPPTPDRMIVEDNREDNLLSRRDLRDYSKDLAALMEYLREPNTRFRGQKPWHDVLVQQQMADRVFYPVDNKGVSLWRRHTGDITLSKNVRHMYDKWLAFRWDQTPHDSVYFVVNLKDNWNGGVRPYVFGQREAIERLVPGHYEKFFGEFMRRHARVDALVEAKRLGTIHYLDVVKNLEAPVWVSLVLKGITDPTPVPAFATTDYTQRWGEQEYEKAVLEIAVEQSLVKLRMPVEEDRLYWRRFPAKKIKRDRQKRLALKLGWRQGTLEERRRGIQKIVAHQKCPERSEAEGRYITHTKFVRTLKPYKK